MLWHAGAWLVAHSPRPLQVQPASSQGDVAVAPDLLHPSAWLLLQRLPAPGAQAEQVRSAGSGIIERDQLCFLQLLPKLARSQPTERQPAAHTAPGGPSAHQCCCSDSSETASSSSPG